MPRVSALPLGPPAEQPDRFRRGRTDPHPAARRAPSSSLPNGGRRIFTKRTLNAALKDVTGCTPANTESFFLTEEMEEALVLDPVKTPGNQPDHEGSLASTVRRKPRKGPIITVCRKEIRLGDILAEMETAGQDDRRQRRPGLPPEKSKEKNADLATRRLSADYPKGRATAVKSLPRPSTRSISGKDSTKEGAASTKPGNPQPAFTGTACSADQ